ncbi:hypothetical protein ACMA1D_23490 [Streptomyces sp. 796.1]|uniref:hypothetical protein n=1 Tax=Streptomyces sp. 796.1 TaxID=3163029 RepID=UPI0039C9F5B9
MAFAFLCPGAVDFGDGAGEALGAALVEGVLAGEGVGLDLLQPLTQGDALALVLGAADLLVEVEQAAWGEGAEEAADFGDGALVVPLGLVSDLGLGEVEHGQVAEGAQGLAEVLGAEFCVRAVGCREAAELGELGQDRVDVLGVSPHVLLGGVQHHAEDQLRVAPGPARPGPGPRARRW